MISAIEGNFKTLARLAGIGNVAGYRLRDVRLLPPNPQVRRGYEHFARLQITASGLPTVSGDNSPTDQVSTIDIVCPVGAFDAPHVFDIAPPAV